MPKRPLERLPRININGRSARTALCLSAVVAAAFGLRINSLGFYNDDYAWLPTMAAHPGESLADIARVVLNGLYGAFMARPLGLVYFPFLSRLCGSNPVFYQTANLLIDTAVAWNFYRLLIEEGIDPILGLSTAVLAALYPNHDSTHHWMTNSVAPLALAGVLWAVRCHRRGARENSRVLSAVAPAAYMFSALLYESSALLALLPAVLEFVRFRREGRSFVSAVRDAFVGTITMTAALAGVVVYQRGIVPYFLHIERHPMSLSATHIWKVTQAGIECSLLNRLTHVIARASQYAVKEFGPGEWAAFILSGCLLIGCERSCRRDEPSPPPDLLLVLAGAFLSLGYAPYFFDPTYTPSVFDPTNRVNLVGSLGGACAWSWVIARFRAARRPSTRVLGGILSAALLAGFLLADQVSGTQWARAFRLQERILAVLDPLVRADPSPMDILLFGAPNRIGAASVFESTYDFDGALQLRYRRPDLHGRATQNGIRFDRYRAVLLSGYGDEQISYEKLYAFDAERGRLCRIPDQTAGDAFLRGIRAR